jgi:hypothetical protein
MEHPDICPRLKSTFGQTDIPQLPEGHDPMLSIGMPPNRPNPAPMGRFPTVLVAFRPVNKLRSAGHGANVTGRSARVART